MTVILTVNYYILYKGKYSDKQSYEYLSSICTYVLHTQSHLLKMETLILGDFIIKYQPTVLNDDHLLKIKVK